MGEDEEAELARSCAEVMWSADDASRGLGMDLLDVGPGTARLSMPVREDMVNGWGICHGGFVSAIADSAFAFACNTHGTVTVAAGFEITFLAPAHVGDLLVATAEQRAARGRSGVYDVTVRLGAATDADVVAEFRGRSRSLGRPIL